jgi:hypothetical protein
LPVRQENRDIQVVQVFACTILLNFLENLGQRVPINRQIPLAKIAEWRLPNLVTGIYQPGVKPVHQVQGKFGRRSRGREVGEGMQHYIGQLPFVCQPFNVFDHFCFQFGLFFVLSFRMEKTTTASVTVSATSCSATVSRVLEYEAQ